MLLRTVDRIACQIELQAKLLGEIQEGPTINVAVLPCLARGFWDAGYSEGTISEEDAEWASEASFQ